MEKQSETHKGRLSRRPWPSPCPPLEHCPPASGWTALRALLVRTTLLVAFPTWQPVLVALGEPIVCPKTAEPTPQMVDEYHAKLCAGYKQVFDAHKMAFGWGHKELQFV